MSESRTVVVTGATSGIGRAIVQAFCAAPGTRVCPIGRTRRKLAAVVRAIPAARLAASGIVDLASATGVLELADRLGSELRRVDVLVHSGGAYGWTELGSTDDAHFDDLFGTNVRGPYLLTQGLLPALARAKGQVVFVNSSIVRGLGEGVGLFKATQHALQGMADSMRQQLNQRGIRVLTVYPGQTATPRSRRIYAHRGQKYSPGALLRPDELARLIVSVTTIPKNMEVTDLHVRSSRRY